jgi:acyl carrier protein
MTIQTIVAEIANILSEKMDIGIGIAITGNTSLIELGLDSIALMTLWVYVEEHFSFVADEDVLFTAVFETIGDIANYVSTKVAA